jgi:neutral ceramidase
MELDTETKAGSFEPTSNRRRTRESYSFRPWLINILRIVLVTGGLVWLYSIATHSSLWKGRKFWAFKSGNHESYGGEQFGSSKGSQYLLGVGKADITGYDIFHSEISYYTYTS